MHRKDTRSLIFTAIAGKMGTWRGGENAIRRGDVVQWLKVKIKPLGQPHVTVTLGEPDHTAIVVSDTAVAGLEDIPETDDGLRALDAACIGSLRSSSKAFANYQRGRHMI